MIDFLIEKGKFYQRFDDVLNERQKKAIERIFREGISGFKGGLSVENYITITGTTASTVTPEIYKNWGNWGHSCAAVSERERGTILISTIQV